MLDLIIYKIMIADLTVSVGEKKEREKRGNSNSHVQIIFTTSHIYK
jgi:hypothetical protein